LSTHKFHVFELSSILTIWHAIAFALHRELARTNNKDKQNKRWRRRCGRVVTKEQKLL